jgi:hypothetical protein
MILNDGNIETDSHFLQFVPLGGDPALLLSFNEVDRKFVKYGDIVCRLDELSEEKARELVVPMPETNRLYPFYFGGDPHTATVSAAMSIWSAAMEFGIPLDGLRDYYLIKIDK